LLRSVSEAIQSATEQPCFHNSDKGTADTKLKRAFVFFVRNLFRRTCAERRWGGARGVGGVGGVGSGHVSKIRTELSGETTNGRYFEGCNYSFAVAMIVGYWYFC
jgi:hypothetical protein